ncbi:MAG: DUF1622 domain-containing protein [Deltaproteobacteria bacterium]|nr:DUF1622 domain-containing protein [Deltaproteobacteria bacterium]
MRHAIELAGQTIEALAVAIIVIAIVHGTVRYLFHIKQKVPDAYTIYKVQIGRALLLGLEFLVAADIVRTVALEPTMQKVLTLGLLVIVRTFLSWALVVEIEGRWPWRSGEGRGGEKVDGRVTSVTSEGLGSRDFPSRPNNPSS